MGRADPAPMIGPDLFGGQVAKSQIIGNLRSLISPACLRRLGQERRVADPGENNRGFFSYW